MTGATTARDPAVTPRVLVLAPDFPPSTGGIQIQVHRVASMLTRLAPVVIAPRATGDRAFDRSAGYVVRRVWPSAGSGRVRKALYLLAMIVAGLHTALRLRLQVVLCAHVIAAPVGWVVSRVFGIPYVVWVYADEMVQPWGFWRWALCRADRVLAISGHSRDLALQIGAAPERTVIVQCAADLPVIGEAVSSGCADSIEGRIILTVSRMDDLYKGHDIVIRSLPLVVSQVPDVRYVMVGDGRHAAYYRRLASSLGLDDHVIFAGRTSEAVRDCWYVRCDVFAMLSRVSPLDGGGEGFGIAFLEASAWGKPVVAGLAGGSVDAVAHEVSGLLVTADDVQAVADGLIRLLRDPELCRRLGRQGRERVEDKFSWPFVTGEIEKVLLTTSLGGHGRDGVRDSRP